MRPRAGAQSADAAALIDAALSGRAWRYPLLNWTDPPGSIELVDESRLHWPFLDDGHRGEAEALSRWVEHASPSLLGHTGDDPLLTGI